MRRLADEAIEKEQMLAEQGMPQLWGTVDSGYTGKLREIVRIVAREALPIDERLQHLEETEWDALRQRLEDRLNQHPILADIARAIANGDMTKAKELIIEYNPYDGRRHFGEEDPYLVVFIPVRDEAESTLRSSWQHHKNLHYYYGDKLIRVIGGEGS